MERLLKPLLVGVMLVAITFLSMSQKILLHNTYQTSETTEWPMHMIHTATFNTIEKAINFHKIVLDMNGVDTSTTVVEMQYEVPVFSSFLASDKKTAIVTYVKKNYFGNYSSFFIECDNVTFELFESDGMMLTQRKIK